MSVARSCLTSKVTDYELSIYYLTKITSKKLTPQQITYVFIMISNFVWVCPSIIDLKPVITIGQLDKTEWAETTVNFSIDDHDSVLQPGRCHNDSGI